MLCDFADNAADKILEWGIKRRRRRKRKRRVRKKA
jgi:hypothetical protein